MYTSYRISNIKCGFLHSLYLSLFFHPNLHSWVPAVRVFRVRYHITAWTRSKTPCTTHLSSPTTVTVVGHRPSLRFQCDNSVDCPNPQSASPAMKKRLFSRKKTCFFPFQKTWLSFLFNVNQR